MTKNAILLGASLESDNRGVNALAIGALTILKNSYGNIQPEIITLGIEEKTVVKEVWINNENLTVKIHYFNSKTLYLLVLSRNFTSSTKKLYEIIKNGDHFYDINEGDSFSDIYGFKRILRHFIDSFLILKFKKKLTFLPQTVGPFKTRIGKVMSTYILRRLDKLYVRDDKFIERLEVLKIPFTKAIDMAVFMSPKPVNDITVPENTIGLNINGLMYFNSYKSMEGKYDSYKNLIERIINFFLEKGNSIMLVPHTYNHLNPNREDDLSAIKHLLDEKYKQENTIFYLNADYNAQEIKYLISKTIFFMGSRMHSCIGALSRSIPTIGLAYSYKFSGTFSMFGCGDHVIDLVGIQDKDLDLIIEKIENLFSEISETKTKLEIANNRKIMTL